MWRIYKTSRKQLKINNEIVEMHFAIHRPRDTVDAPLAILICTIYRAGFDVRVK